MESSFGTSRPGSMLAIVQADRLLIVYGQYVWDRLVPSFCPNANYCDRLVGIHRSISGSPPYQYYMESAIELA